MSFLPYMTSEDLIESVKRKIAFPLSQETFDEEDILHFANEEMMISLVPQVLSFHEEFFVFNEKQQLTEGKLRYPIPARAIGMKLRDCFYEDVNGNLFEMTRIDASNKDLFQRNLGDYQNVHKYYFENNDVVLSLNAINVAVGKIVMQYFMRPNQLVLSDRAAFCKTLVRDTSTVTMTFEDINGSLTLPANFETGSKIDFLQKESGHKLFTKDIILPSIVDGAYVFDATLIPEDFQVGDYICSQYECIIPQIPDDLHSGLAERVCSRILSSLGDMQGLQVSQAKVNDIENRTGNLIDNRSDGNCIKVVPRHSILRYNKARYKRF